MKTGAVSACAIGLLLASAGSALAGPIAVDFRGTALGKGASVTFASGDGAAFTNRNLFVGQLVHRMDIMGSGQRDFITYCIDLTQYAGDGQFNLVNLRDAPVTSPAPSNKWALNKDQVDALNSLYHAHFVGADTNNEAAAFQAAVWEIVFDWSSVEGGTFTPGNTWNLTQGVVRINNNISNTFFTQYLSAAVAEGNTRNILGAIVSGSKQDQLVVIPLPGAGALAGAGMLVMASRRRRTTL